jgi:hypothetical protein
MKLEMRDRTSQQIPKKSFGIISIRKYFKNLFSNRLENLEEMEKFLGAYNLPILSQEDTNHLNRTTTCSETDMQ